MLVAARASLVSDPPRRFHPGGMTTAPGLPWFCCRGSDRRWRECVQSLLAVNPVPWARSQMAFTLATHIILVPLGVSWAFMTLVANYKAVRHDDRSALL